MQTRDVSACDPGDLLSAQSWENVQAQEALILFHRPWLLVRGRVFTEVFFGQLSNRRGLSVILPFRRRVCTILHVC
jgi:hypothetical protein